MTTPAKVSVLIPCFNLGQYLNEAVDSVQEQTYQDFEILIVDDGSTDPFTQQLLASFTRPRTTVFRTANMGLAAARNFLISHAAGDYLCALDADDKLHPQYLERTVEILDRDPSVAFVSTRLQMFGDEDRLWPTAVRCDIAVLLCDDTVTTAALVRRSAVASVGGYDERMPYQGDEDWDLWISLTEAGHRGIILPDVLFYYRRRPNSMCVECTSGSTHIELMKYLVRKHAASYRTHLVEVLLNKESTISDLRRANIHLEAEITTELLPRLERRRVELEALHRKLKEPLARSVAGQASVSVDDVEREIAAVTTPVDQLTAEYHRCLAEVRALRQSASWRLTAPLRWTYERMLGLRRWSSR